MRWARKLRLRLRSLLRSRRVEQELDEEIRYHQDRLADDLIAAGMPPAAARQAARRELGPLDSSLEQCRDARGVTRLESIARDAGYAARALRRSPGFTAVALASLALGIGATATMFTFVEAILLRPLPYPGADRLVVLREQPVGSPDTVNVHPQNFLEWRARAQAFEWLTLVQLPPITVIGAEGAEQIPRAQVTPELFRVFGVAPAIGREFTDAEGRPGEHHVVILSHGFWQRWFGGDPGVVGRTLQAGDGPLTIVGVAPAGFRIGSADLEVYTPLAIDPARPGAIGSRSFQCYGRLKPGVSVETARGEMAAIAAALSRQYALDEGYGVFVAGLHEYLVADVRPALRLLMAVVAVVLVIACANLASLLLARGLQRRGEISLRGALGATRARLIQQLLVESLTLGLLGGALGLALAYWATQALVTLTADTLRVGTTTPVQLDAAGAGFTLVLCIVTAVAAGLAPAWQASDVDPGAALQLRTRGTNADPRQLRWRSVLVTAEVALAIVLLVGAGLLLRSFGSLLRVDLGFQPAGTLTMNLFLGVRPAEFRVSLIDQILDRVETVPGVSVASTIQFLPLSGMTCGTAAWTDENGRAGRDLPAECSLISRGYFDVMGIPILEGRAFERSDRATSPLVAIVNRTFATRYFASGGALGRRIRVHGATRPPAEIVGIARDSRHGLVDGPAPAVYMLHSQTPGYITHLVVRTVGNPAQYGAAIRRAIQEVDPAQAVANVKTMDTFVEAGLARPRLYASLVTGFASIAALLAVVGIYGLSAYTVSQRRHEIGIRLALGATRLRIFVDVFRQGALLVLAGTGAGLLAAFAFRGVVATLLFGVAPLDLVSYAAASAAFAGIATAALVVPSLRAAASEPVAALRHD